MNDDQTDSTDAKPPDNAVPTQSTQSLTQQTEPDHIGETFKVPEEIVNAGHDTNEPLPDSPETLDEDINQGPALQEIQEQYKEEV